MSHTDTQIKAFFFFFLYGPLQNDQAPDLKPLFGNLSPVERTIKPNAWKI